MKNLISSITGLSCLALFMSIFMMNLTADEGRGGRDQAPPRRPKGEEEHRRGEPERDHRDHEQAERMEQKIKHLHEAAENLELAGLGDEAHRFREAAENMEREIDRRHEAGKNGHRPPGEVFEKIHHLERQLEEMRKVIHRQQEQIEELRRQVNHR